MLSMLKNLFSKETCSKVQAKNRLQFVLVQDRAGLNNDELASFRKELLSVIEKYFIVKESDFGIDYKRDGNSTKLTINSPVVAKRELGKSTCQNKTSCCNNDCNDEQDDKLEIKSKNSNNNSNNDSNNKNFKKKKAAN